MQDNYQWRQLIISHHEVDIIYPGLSEACVDSESANYSCFIRTLEQTVADGDSAL